MKTLLAAAALALCMTFGASAQTRPVKQPHASVPDQKMCYDQATKYVRDKNADMPNWYSFIQAHFNSAARVCYVRYIHVVRASESATDSIDDAFEGPTLAHYSDGACYLAGGVCEAEDTNHFKIVLTKYFPWVFAKIGE
jgi:hypothetical protein